MKKSLLVLLIVFVNLNVLAQSEEIELLKTAYKVEKKELLMDFLMLEESESTDFWLLYDTYQLELSKTANRRFALIKKYDEYYNQMTDEESDALVAESFKIRGERENLQKKYFKKIKKGFGSKRAAQFVQFERFIQIEIDDELNSSFPLIGERF